MAEAEEQEYWRWLVQEASKRGGSWVGPPFPGWGKGVTGRTGVGEPVLKVLGLGPRDDGGRLGLRGLEPRIWVGRGEAVLEYGGINMAGWEPAGALTGTKAVMAARPCLFIAESDVLSDGTAMKLHPAYESVVPKLARFVKATDA